MKIEKGYAHSVYPYVTVSVDANELQCDVRKLPYPTWIGTIDLETWKIRRWNPAASIPRGYPRAAETALAAACGCLQEQDAAGNLLRAGTCAYNPDAFKAAAEAATKLCKDEGVIV